MNVKLSSKGQLVIPGPIRRALGLEQGDELSIEVVENHIVLAPLTPRSPEDALYGLLRDTDVVAVLEEDHRHELGNERDVRPR